MKINKDINVKVANGKNAEIGPQEDINESKVYYEVYMYDEEGDGDNESIYFETNELALEFIEKSNMEFKGNEIGEERD